MNHKRKGPKSTRAGCLLCKPHKRQGGKPRARADIYLAQEHTDYHDAGKPNPGSYEATDNGCTCAVLDNAHGLYARNFWITEGCPVHT